MIVGIANGAEYRLLAAQIGLGRAVSLVAPIHQDFNDAYRQEVFDLILSAISEINAARHEIYRLTRAGGAVAHPRSCNGCDRPFVERDHTLERCTVCQVLPGWRGRPELIDIIHPGLAPQEPK